VVPTSIGIANPNCQLISKIGDDWCNQVAEDRTLLMFGVGMILSGTLALLPSMMQVLMLGGS
jgi:hypothetical protein